MKRIIFISLLCLVIACQSIHKPENIKEQIINTVGSEITIEGIAQNAKSGGVIITNDSVIYYIEGVDSWEDNFYNKKVKVKGILDYIDWGGSTDSDSIKIQSGEGKWNLIKKAEYTLVQ